MTICDTINAAIQRGGYLLEDMLHRIDYFFASGELTDAERDRLYAAAREGARANIEPGSEIPRIWEAIREIRARLDTVENGTAEQGGTETEDEWPPYKPPTGAHDAYYRGARISSNDKHYICTAPEGFAVIWPPDVTPMYWEEQNEV